MHEKQIDCISVGKVKPRKKRNRNVWLSGIAYTIIDMVVRVFDLICSMAIIVILGALAGAGFGWGLALISVWL